MCGFALTVQSHTQHFSSLDQVFLERLMVLAWLATNLMFAIPKCLTHIQDVPGGNVNILGGHSIGHSKQKYLYEHVSYSERFPR